MRENMYCAKISTFTVFSRHDYIRDLTLITDVPRESGILCTLAFQSLYYLHLKPMHVLYFALAFSYKSNATQMLQPSVNVAILHC